MVDETGPLDDDPPQPQLPADGDNSVRLETRFDPIFVARLALREKQIQQSYRPIIGVHKWFARRPGTLFRNLLLAEFDGPEPLASSYWRGHRFQGVIADPFMGGGSPLYEANRLGFGVVGADINPMAYWVVRQSLLPLDVARFVEVAEIVAKDVERDIGHLFRTRCLECGRPADVKYFLWVKTACCPLCGSANDLFPGYLVAEATRHPRHVVICRSCGELNEYTHQPTADSPLPCARCGASVHTEGPARRNRIRCHACRAEFAYPAGGEQRPSHRLFAIEYHCQPCKPDQAGRFFKQPDNDDLANVTAAEAEMQSVGASLPIPVDPIPPGDETDRLLRWGYRRYRDLFNDRQLLGLGLLLKRIQAEPEVPIRHALLTVFSDFLRYQNMLCRYDTYALKCQDIFSVHGFPVGLVQCENSLLGVPRVGSGAFRHFVEKYKRAKEYADQPFETRLGEARHRIAPVPSERIAAELVARIPSGRREAWLHPSPAQDVDLPANVLDGVFTDPPYFDNVQYAELMDFCYVWLRQTLSGEVEGFDRATTRSLQELTGNTTLGRGLDHFTAGLSSVFSHYGRALKPGAPFVFTYHHNDAAAYVPLVVSILDAGLDCTATLPAPAEMGASLHIARTSSSILDSVFVCRRPPTALDDRSLETALADDELAMTAAGLRVTEGDRRCLRAGHLARLAINLLRPCWERSLPIEERLRRARAAVVRIEEERRLAGDHSIGAVKEVALAPAV